MNLQNDFANYEQSLTLKELGFDEPCYGFYTSTGRYVNNYNDLDVTYSYLAPLKQQVLRWFRDNGYRFTIYFDITEQGRYMFDVFKRDEEKNWWQFYHESRLEYETYEDVENACIDKLIELTKK